MARIVIVEDDALVAMGIRFYLESRGHEIPAIAATGERAIEAAAEAEPDMVLMDVRLKGEMDGIEAAQRILARRHVPILFVSGSGEPQTMERMQAVDHAGLLLKPVVPAQLASEVERILRSCALVSAAS